MQENKYKEQALNHLEMLDRQLALVYDAVKRGENTLALRIMDEPLKLAYTNLQSIIEAERDSLNSTIGHLP